MDGIILINKEKGMTSRDMVNMICKKLNSRRVGHTGTLDPNATGLMVICVGQALKLVELLTGHDKDYTAKVKLGIKTDTYDITGKVLEQNNDYTLNKEKLITTLESFNGEYEQVVPMYSSIKVNGKKLYQYALKDIEIERTARNITIYNIKRLTDLSNNEFSYIVESSKGLYVRTLCSDIASKLNELGTMKELKRLKLGDYSLDDSVDLDNASESNIIPLIDVIDKFPKVEVKDYLVPLIKNGITLDSRQTNIKEVFKVVNNNKILALYKPVGDVYKPVIIL